MKKIIISAIFFLVLGATPCLSADDFHPPSTAAELFNLIDQIAKSGQLDNVDYISHMLGVDFDVRHNEVDGSKICGDTTPDYHIKKTEIDGVKYYKADIYTSQKTFWSAFGLGHKSPEIILKIEKKLGCSGRFAKNPEIDAELTLYGIRDLMAISEETLRTLRPTAVGSSAFDTTDHFYTEAAWTEENDGVVINYGTGLADDDKYYLGGIALEKNEANGNKAHRVSQKSGNCMKQQRKENPSISSESLIEYCGSFDYLMDNE